MSVWQGVPIGYTDAKKDKLNTTLNNIITSNVPTTNMIKLLFSWITINQGPSVRDQDIYDFIVTLYLYIQAVNNLTDISHVKSSTSVFSNSDYNIPYQNYVNIIKARRIYELEQEEGKNVPMSAPKGYIMQLGGANKNKHKYKNRMYMVRTGSRGGKYILVNKEKVYI